MEAIIEHNVATQNICNDAKLELFAMIMSISSSDNIIELKRKLIINNVFEYIKYGFGSNHMWVKMVVNGEIQNNRLIFCKY